MTLDPKKDFLNSLHKKRWEEIVASETFTAAVTAALVIQQQNLNAAPDLATAASYHYRMEGAKQLLGILMNLPIPPTSGEKERIAAIERESQNLRWGKT